MGARRLTRRAVSAERRFRRLVWHQRVFLTIWVIYLIVALTKGFVWGITIALWCHAAYLYCTARVLRARSEFAITSDRLDSAVGAQEATRPALHRALEAEQRALVLEQALGIKQRCDEAVAKRDPPEPLSPTAVAASLDLAVERIATTVERLNDPAVVDELLAIGTVLTNLRTIVLHDGRVEVWRLNAAKQYGAAFVDSSDRLLANLREANSIQAKRDAQTQGKPGGKPGTPGP